MVGKSQLSSHVLSCFNYCICLSADNEKQGSADNITKERVGSGIARNLAVHNFFFFSSKRVTDCESLLQAFFVVCILPHVKGITQRVLNLHSIGRHGDQLWYYWWQPWTMDDVLSSGASCWGSYPWMNFQLQATDKKRPDIGNEDVKSHNTYTTYTVP